ncbi:hydrophobic/amphiphilic exporter-1, HAE1 family [Fodinibius roseus]|uniref:Hydrophobic/amphiphilic exporter-1, HAE1 family n=2 Tax=Fodinibius roseus TaxID=1194090 RepID=A0A1M5BMK7_9BACT|nr:hydrophobic/amphiphilic exporter-1, HAE1 family [Fodinibius roseus]
MLILATLIFGTIALSELSVSLLPEVDSPTLLVRTDWSGAAPREVEQRINEPMEAVLSTVKGLESVHGFARQGQSIISLRFKWGQNMDLSFLNVREKLDQIRYTLPEQADRPQLVQNTASDEPIAVLGVTSLNESDPDFGTRLNLKRWAEQVLSRRLEQADGIAQTVLVGAVEPEVQIRFRPKALNRFGVSLSEVENLVSQANLFTATGELRDGWYRYSLKIQSRIKSIGDVQEVPLKTLGTGRVLKLSDVAEVQLDEADPTSFSLVDEHEVLSVLVKKEYGANTVEAYDTMLPLLDELRGQNANIGITVLQENASFIRNAINNLLQTLLYGAVLAFIVLFLFLDNWRTPFTIGVAIPVSIFLTFFVMFISDIQLNIVSLSGLTLGIGLLVDNAIIVLENINRHRSASTSVFEAADLGTREIALAVTASTLTTISVFLPLVFLGGFEGAFFQDQAWTLSISLLASLGVALLILPVLVTQFQKEGEGGSSVFGVNRFFDRMRDRYEQSLQWALRRKALFLGGMSVLLIAALYLFMLVHKSVLPETEPRQLRYQVRLPGNTSLHATRQAAESLINRLNQMKQEDRPIRVLGGYTDQTNLSNLSEEGINKFTMSIPVDGYAMADRVRETITGYFQEQPGWTTKPLAVQNALNVLPSASEPPVLFRLVDKNRRQSEQLAPRLQERLRSAGLDITLARQYEQELDTYQLRFKTQNLLQLGISEQEVIRYLESLTRGSWITDWNRQDENVPIRLVGYDRQIFEPENIVLDLNNRQVPLVKLASIERASEPEQLERVNQTPVLSYMGDISFTDWWWRGEEIRASLTDFARETGTEVQVGGAVMGVASLLSDMGLLLLISVVIIYIILSVQFESLRHPLIILAAVPFAWVGSVAVLWMTGISLNALSFMGILILTGIAVNDSILKVDFMRRYLADTGDLHQAITQAGLHRFRPVVMTSLTTIFGLIPMLLPFGDGYAFRQSLALALMGGMVTSTLLTLYLVPIIFQWVEGRRIRNGKIRN